MRLTGEEREMLAGGQGEAVRRALAYQIEVGRFLGAERFVPVTGVHMMGDIEVMGDGGLAYLQETEGLGARCRVGVTTNARCFDFAWSERLGQDAGEAAKERELIACLRRMGVATVDSCILYQAGYRPAPGEHVAWGDTGTVVYANSVLGARSNFESGPAALAAAVTGRTPEYGFHLDANRRGTFVVELDAALDDLADWGAVGRIVGERHQDYAAVPVLVGSGRRPTDDELKHLGAALASYGSMGMFHLVGVTPEAPSLEAALGGNRPLERIVVGDADVERVYRSYEVGDGEARLVVFSGPQQSLAELERLAGLFEGRAVATGTSVFVTSSAAVLAQARLLGHTATLERAGVTILEGVCFYILQNLSPIRAANGWSRIVSNSAKILNIVGAHRFDPVLRRTAECVEIACTGRVT